MKAKTKTFSRMSKAAKRVAIAKDAIKQIEAGRLKATPGLYITFNDSIEGVEGDLQDFLPKTTCKVCALGAVFAGAVSQFDKFSMDGCVEGWQGDYVELETLQNHISGYFPKEDLLVIEKAFEGHDAGNGRYRGDPNEVRDTAWRYARRIRSPRTRLLTILRNIIRNRGTFIPTERDFVRAKGK